MAFVLMGGVLTLKWGGGIRLGPRLSRPECCIRELVHFPVVIGTYGETLDKARIIIGQTEERRGYSEWMVRKELAQKRGDQNCSSASRL